MRWYYACKVRKFTVFIKGIYISVNSRMSGLVCPKIQKQYSRHVRTWDDVMHVKFANLLYLSTESIFQWTHTWPDWFARTTKNKIADVRTWEDIIHKVHLRYCIYLRNLYFRELTHGRTGSPDHPKENSRYMHPWDDLMHVTYAKVLCLSKESISQRTQAWPDWFSRRSKRE